MRRPDLTWRDRRAAHRFPREFTAAYESALEAAAVHLDELEAASPRAAELTLAIFAHGMEHPVAERELLSLSEVPGVADAFGAACDAFSETFEAAI